VRASEIVREIVEGAGGSRLFAVAHSKQAALGFRAHSGWTALIAVCADRGSPAVLARREFISLKLSTYEFRQPYHTAKKMPPDEGREFISRMQEEARRLLTTRSATFNRVAKTGAENSRDAVFSLPLAKRFLCWTRFLLSHALIHTADGELFREALLHAALVCGLRDFRVKSEKSWTRRASLPPQARRYHASRHRIGALTRLPLVAGRKVRHHGRMACVERFAEKRRQNENVKRGVNLDRGSISG